MAARKKSRKKTAKKSPRKAARKAVQKRVSKPAKKAAKKTARKTKKTAALPKGFHTVTASLCLQDAAFAMQFYEKAFGAKELYRLTEPGGKIGHAEMQIGDSVLMLSDEYPDMAILSAKTLNGSPIRLSLVVKNTDAVFAQAVAAGATMMRPVQDEFYGWRSGVVMDPFGYSWCIMHKFADIAPAEMQDRWTKMLAAHKPESSAS